MYFVEHQKAIINLADYSIEFRGEKIPSTVISTEHEKKMKIYRVQLAKRTNIILSEKNWWRCQFR
jgi:hypothetical protein